MKIGKCELEYHVDYINRKIHILDLDQPMRRTLTNEISPDFQKRFVAQEELLQDCLEFDWICYGTDGIICSYSNYNFKYQNPKLPYLFEPYVKEMDNRRHPYTRGMA